MLVVRHKLGSIKGNSWNFIYNGGYSSKVKIIGLIKIIRKNKKKSRKMGMTT